MKNSNKILLSLLILIFSCFIHANTTQAASCNGSYNDIYQDSVCINGVCNNSSLSETDRCQFYGPGQTNCGVCVNFGSFCGSDQFGNCVVQHYDSTGICANLPQGQQEPNPPTATGNGTHEYDWYPNGTGPFGNNCVYQATPLCTQGASNCGACISGAWPTNTCGYISGNQTCDHDQPQVCTTTSFNNPCSYQYNNCSANYTCPTGAGFQQACITNINVHVYVDYNHDGVKNGNDAGYNYQNNSAPTPGSYAVVSDGGGNNINANTSGNVTFTGKTTGNYTISLSSVPTGYAVVGSSSQGVSLTNTSGNATVSFYITPLYTLSGTVFSDTNKDASPSAGEGLSAWSVQISGQGVNPSTSTDTNGAYSFSNLKSGNYTVKLTQTLPAGYSYLVPKPPSWSIYLGNPSGPVSYVCSTGGAAGATCGGLNNGSISGLNFSVTNENTFIQPICSDARFNGGYSQLIPSTANCGGTSSPYAIYTDSTNSSCSTNPGILYGGSVNPNYGTGLGASTPTNQAVGNANYPENFTSPIPNTVQTSYSFVMTSLNNLITAPTPLSSVCPSLSSCDLSTLSPGVYTTTKADGPVTFLVSNPSSTLTAGNYTFVIGNDITFTTKVLLPSGSSAFFTSGGNIHVTGNSSLGNAGEVGESNWNSVSPDLEGFFSADGSFYIDRVDSTASTCNADATPIDNKLNIKGSVVVNAAGAGGSVVTNRDGCVQDKFCPTVTFTTDPLQILHTPTPLKPPYTVWQELNP